MERSPEYEKVRQKVERVMASVVQENMSPTPIRLKLPVRAAAWNIERGTALEGITKVLQSHPRIKDASILFLTELDYGMARSSNLFIAYELARSLEMNYVFAPCYLALNKGSGLESEVAGENVQSLHGNALFSKFPLQDAHSLALPNGKDLMRGNEKRLGCQRAVIATVHHPEGPFLAVSLHLDAHSSQRHRHYQMKLVLDHLDSLGTSLPVLIGGDWNTSTYNSRRALFSILGYVRRVLMGVHRVIDYHYPYPDRWFERHLFRELERRGYEYRNLNQPGTCTLHYNVKDLAANRRMADWIPNWCFWFINWALEKNQGLCSMKLDWFAGKNIEVDSTSPPLVISDVHTKYGVLSDHDPIVLEFRFHQK